MPSTSSKAGSTTLSSGRAADAEFKRSPCRPSSRFAASRRTVGSFRHGGVERPAQRSRHALHGFRRGGSGEVTASHRAWRRDDTGSFVPTPALGNGRVYLLQDLGTLDCVDPADGKLLWSGAFPRSKAKFYVSPVIAGDRLYALRDDGAMFVVGVADGFELLATGELGEKVVASPEALDLAMVFGTGFAPFRGGLWKYAEDRGFADVNRRLLQLAHRYGPRFDASEPLLEAL